MVHFDVNLLVVVAAVTAIVLAAVIDDFFLVDHVGGGGTGIGGGFTLLVQHIAQQIEVIVSVVLLAALSVLVLLGGTDMDQERIGAFDLVEVVVYTIENSHNIVGENFLPLGTCFRVRGVFREYWFP
ncbi:MAG: hypothetical protein IPO55_02285 [Alphaproteobacteria bacterium]|nr:hypothetical protein [Alphaproteobacteria bacterium]